ncbi:mannitol dehydrogenase family protein [Bacteroides sp.]|uniref:mannitol dehydrogenase family protein n=1 Tax=Bacteroides sp. TaxID=29523 RepID=UPI00262847B1|nr:mannitol dehydrogenase family protein [Bacteroides sp.]MDD3039805.1 mannitol dehydrogenase family protein [Bacteroides sp.]
MKTQVISYSYNRTQVKTGILHIGVGNFHRAHEEYYTSLLLDNPTQQGWGICGAMLLPSDEHLYRALKKQENEYTLTVCGRDGKDEVYRIGSLVELIWGIENPEAVIAKIADKNIRIITLTITEGGYNIEKSTGEFMREDENINYDLTHPEAPKTTFGFVAEGLRRRKDAGNGPITILSCDNLQHNGHTARKAFTSFIKAQDPELAAWITENVTFPNSMVDRITPATRPDDIIRLNTQNRTVDEAPVYCEDFVQWVIEDKFIAGRPAWEEVGVEFTQDVTAYENMKLSLLNASHQLLSYPSFLSGYRKVDDAMHDERIAKFVRMFMDVDITPYVPAPGNTDLDLYKQTLIERFGNRSVSDQVARLCFDGISKFPVYIMPNLIKMIKDHADLSRVAYLFATYRHYLKYKVDDKGIVFEIAEPWMTTEDEALINSDDPIDFLGLSPFQSTDLKAAGDFVKQYLQMADAIKEKGAMPVLESILA